MKNAEWLSKQCIFGNAVSLAASQTGDRAEHQRTAGRSREMQDGLFKARNEANDQSGKPMKESDHVDWNGSAARDDIVFPSLVQHGYIKLMDVFLCPMRFVQPYGRDIPGVRLYKDHIRTSVFGDCF